MVRFLKFKFLITILKLNFNGGQFYKKILNFGYFKKWEKIHNKIVKFEIPNFERLRRMKKGRVNKDQISHVWSIGNSVYGNLHKIGAN